MHKKDLQHKEVIMLKKRGILAYGSLIDIPGDDIKNSTSETLNVETPFRIEFARSSRSHGGAPTLVPVKKDGSKNNAHILVLKDGITPGKAKNMLYQREMHIPEVKYPKSARSSTNAVVIRFKRNFHNINVVYYTQIDPNIEQPITAQKLAILAIKSVRSAPKNMDGISYLIQAKRNGIHTPLTDSYEKAILDKTGAKTLDDALIIVQKKNLA